MSSHDDVTGATPSGGATNGSERFKPPTESVAQNMPEFSIVPFETHRLLAEVQTQLRAFAVQAIECAQMGQGNGILRRQFHGLLKGPDGLAVLPRAFEGQPELAVVQGIVIAAVRP